MARCENCGKKLGLLDPGSDGMCFACNEAAHSLNDQEASVEAREYVACREVEIEGIIITTETYTNLNIIERIDVVTAECAYGMNVFKDLFVSVRNVTGGRSKAMQQTMRDARETVLYELKKEAYELGANAVVAIDLDYTQISDSGWNMILLVASGTAVRVSDETGGGSSEF